VRFKRCKRSSVFTIHRWVAAATALFNLVGLGGNELVNWVSSLGAIGIASFYNGPVGSLAAEGRGG